MHKFISIKDIESVYFDSCSGCLKNCCSGKNINSEKKTKEKENKGHETHKAIRKRY